MDQPARCLDYGTAQVEAEPKARAVAGPEFALVAEGMGSFSGGGLAAQLLIEVLPFELRKASEEGVAAPLEGAFRVASDLVREVTRLHEQFQGMAACTAAVRVSDGRVQIAHGGDCRVYRLRHGALERLTRDHVVESDHHPLGHLVTCAIPANAVELQSVSAAQGEWLLLCTGEIHRVMPDEQLRALWLDLKAAPGPLAGELIRKAVANGARHGACVVAKLCGSFGAEDAGAP